MFARDSLSAVESLTWRLVYSPNTSPAAVRMAENMTQMLHVTPMGISSTFYISTDIRLWLALSTDLPNLIFKSVVLFVF